MSEENNTVLDKMFLGLGSLSFIGGLALVFMALFDAYTIGNTGPGVYADALISGSLFAVMGIGFATFGGMLRHQKWEADDAAAVDAGH